MAVKDISHDANGKQIERVPIVHKVALGLPKGHKARPDSTPLNAPRKIFSFLVQTRDENGEWKYDKELAVRLFGERDEDRKQPREIKIQLIGSNIDDMVYSDLFYWSGAEGAKCSAKTMKFYMQQWCEDKNIPWVEPLSSVTTITELNMLLDEKKIDKRMGDFVEEAKSMVKNFQESVGGEYDIDESDIVTSTVAIRKPDSSGPRYPYPCTFMKCPDYMKNDCRYNGRFFFLFDGDDMGEVSTLVTTSPKIIQNIQWGLKNMIGKVLKGRTDEETGNSFTLHGLPCRLVGRPERGTYTYDGKQHSTKFFVVRLKGPADTMIDSAKIILNKAKEMIKLYPGEFRVRFDEGDEIQLAKERLNEFSEKTNMKAASDGSEFKIGDEKIEQKKKKKETKDTKYSEEVKTILSKTKKVKDDEKLVHMINVFSKAIDNVPVSNGSKMLSDAFIGAVEKETITIDSILKSQANFDKFGSEVDLAKELKLFNKSKKENK